MSIYAFHGAGFSLYPLNQWEKREVFWCFKEVCKEFSDTKWNQRVKFILNLRISITGADPAFLIRARPNSVIFLWDRRKLFKRASFFCSIKNFLIFRGSTFYCSFVVIIRNWVCIRPVYKNLFLKKQNFYLLDIFLGSFFWNQS